MSWRITPSFTPADEYFQNVSLLLHGNQSGGQFVDSSPSPKAITTVGDAAPGSPGGGTPVYPLNNSAFGSAIVFDKVDDRLTLAASSDFAFGTGDFTIEAWVYSRDVLGSAARGILQISSTAGGISTTYPGIAIFQGSNANAGVQNGGIGVAIGGNNYFGTAVSAPAVLFVNQWQHVAVTRSGGACKVFVDGIQTGSRTSSANLTSSHLVVGGYYDPSYLFDGFLDEIRITKGVARYTADFNPPTAPFPDI